MVIYGIFGIMCTNIGEKERVQAAAARLRKAREEPRMKAAQRKGIFILVSHLFVPNRNDWHLLCILQPNYHH
jgi:hypothetical protein